MDERLENLGYVHGEYSLLGSCPDVPCTKGGS